MQTDQLGGKIALISGTGGGLGRALARVFASQGAVVVGCDLDARRNDETVALVRANGGQMFGSGVFDLGDPAQAKAWIDTAVYQFGRIDILCNNAGAARFGAIGMMAIEDWQFTMRNELDVAFYPTHYAWKHLARPGGVVINIASVAAHIGAKIAPMVPHAAANGAVLAMTRQLAVEGAPDGLRAVSVSPGTIRTPANDTALNDAATRAALFERNLLGRVAEATEVAQLAAFLASDAASFITGTDHRIDGGETAI